jgi:hypothetical protein
MKVKIVIKEAMVMISPMLKSVWEHTSSFTTHNDQSESLIFASASKFIFISEMSIKGWLTLHLCHNKPHTPQRSKEDQS